MRRHRHEEYLTEIASTSLVFERLPVLTDKSFMDQMLYLPEKACTALKLLLLSIFLSLLSLS